MEEEDELPSEDPLEEGDGDELPPEDSLEDGDGDELPPEDPLEGGNGDELPDDPLLPDELGDCMLLELHPASLSITVETMIFAKQQSVIFLMSSTPRAKPSIPLYRRQRSQALIFWSPIPALSSIE